MVHPGLINNSVAHYPQAAVLAAVEVTRRVSVNATVNMVSIRRKYPGLNAALFFYGAPHGGTAEAPSDEGGRGTGQSTVDTVSAHTMPGSNSTLLRVSTSCPFGRKPAVRPMPGSGFSIGARFSWRVVNFSPPVVANGDTCSIIL